MHYDSTVFCCISTLCQNVRKSIKHKVFGEKRNDKQHKKQTKANKQKICPTEMLP